jgi:hypothetical protein
MQPSTRAQLVVSTETGGLGNRIKSWVSAMRLGEDARVRWSLSSNMSAGFADLFRNDCAVDEAPPHAVVYSSWRLAVLPEDEAYLPAGFATVGGGAHPIVRGTAKAWWALTGRRTDRYRYMLFPKQHSRRSSRRDGRHIDLEYGRIPEPVRRAYLPFFERIAVQPEIARRASEWADRNLGDDVVGVQVRTWRDDERRYRKYHVPAVRRLDRLIDSVPRQRLLVVSDSDEIIAELAARHGSERVLHFPRATRRRDSWRSVEGVREDLIDMLLLSRTPRLFLSYLSTFGEVAWWLGGATASVEVF